MLSDAARALVKRHLDNGDLCVLVTATNSFVTGPIARGDVATVRAHTTALHGTRPYHDVYEVVSRATLALMRERGDDPVAVQALTTALDADGLR